MKLKSKDAVIAEFVEAIAQHYIAEKNIQNQGDSEEFVSAIEQDIKSTLRDKLSKLATVREVEETPTVELSGGAVSGGAVSGAVSEHAITGISEKDSSGYDFPSNAVTRQTKPGVPSAQVDATLDSEVGAQLLTDLRSRAEFDNDAPTMDTANLDSNDGTKPVVRAGNSPEYVDMSYDDGLTMDGGESETVESAPKVDVPDDYEIIKTLGKGGMGVVYKARHVPLNRVVAVKMILSGAHASKDQIARFQREAEAAAHLSHPNIVSVFEVGQHNGMPFFSLEYVDGESMSELMVESTLSDREAAKLLLPVARAVQYSHEKGVLHRDLKPQNILLTNDGTPKVADFGLAKRLNGDDEENKTVTGTVLGTPGYMAPEQARDTESVGPHTDVYALGCIMYYLMTGRPPFNAPTPIETVRQLLVNDPVAPSRLQSGLDQDFETICMKALEKEIPRRYQTAGELADELQRFIEGQPIVARPITRKERLWKWCKRNPRVATLSGVAASLLLCLLFGGIISAIVINEQKKAEQFARQEADANAVLAEDQAELALDSTRLVLYETKKFFEGRPELQRLRESMINGILKSVERIHTERYVNDVSGTFTASAAAQLGQIYLEAGRLDKALSKLQEAENQLVVLNQNNTLSNADISQMNLTLALGDTYRGLGELDKAESRYLKLLDLRKQYFRRNQTFSDLLIQQSMAEVYGRLATVYRLLGKPNQALQYAMQSVEARRNAADENPDSVRAREELGGALISLSETYEKLGETDKMIEASRKALDEQAYVATQQSNLSSVFNAARGQKILARQCLLFGRNEEARELLTKATKTLEELLESTPDNKKIESQAVDGHTVLGIVLSRLGEKDQAKAQFDRAIEIQERQLAKSDNVNTRGVLLKLLARAGRVDEALKLADEMAESPDKLMNCGYAACGYALVSEHLVSDETRQQELLDKAIDFAMKLVDHGYHDFESMRRTDFDFEPLQKNKEFLKRLGAKEESVLAAKTK